MCVVSMVMDDFHRKWSPQFPGAPLIPLEEQKPVWPQPGTPLPPLDTKNTKVNITMEEWLEYQRLKNAAKLQDERDKNPDCQKPELEAWEKEFIKHLIKTGVLKEDQLTGDAP